MFQPIKLLVCLVLASFLLFPTEVSQASPVSQTTPLTGTFSILWGDPGPGSNLPPTMQYFLTDAQWNMTEILLDKDLARPFGGVLALNGARVTLFGERFVPREARYRVFACGQFRVSKK